MPRIVNSTTPLKANGTANNADTFVYGIETGLGDYITGSVFADQNGTLTIEQSGDGTNWDAKDTIAVTASTGTKIDVKILLPYVRIKFVNTAGSDQTAFRLFTRVTSAGPR